MELDYFVNVDSEINSKPNFRYYCLLKVGACRLIVDTETWTYTFRTLKDLGIRKKEVMFCDSLRDFHVVIRFRQDPSRNDDSFLAPSRYFTTSDAGNTRGAKMALRYKHKIYNLQVIPVDIFRRLYKLNTNMLTLNLVNGEECMYDNLIMMAGRIFGVVKEDKNWYSIF